MLRRMTVNEWTIIIRLVTSGEHSRQLLKTKNHEHADAVALRLSVQLPKVESCLSHGYKGETLQVR